MEKIKTQRTDKAQSTSFSAHFRQVDKSGKSYFLHPLEIALKMTSESAVIVAFLHDVFEDTDLQIREVEYLRESERVALKLLTKRREQYYEDYIAGIKENKLATEVKIEDLKHNLKDRGWTPPPERIAKYKKALKLLSDE